MRNPERLLILPVKKKKERILVTLMCCFGIMAVGYGMAKENHPIFLVGLLFVIAGYLLVRRRLKHAAQNKSCGCTPR
jgi:hypothetical protein